MKPKGHTPEQVVRKLREGDRILNDRTELVASCARDERNRHPAAHRSSWRRAASNLADRLVFGAVRDFIPTPLVVFNVADIAVVCGVVAFVWSMTRAPLTPAPVC